MPKNLEGNIIAKDKRVAIVVSRFNDLLTKKLLEGAIDKLIRNGVKETNIDGTIE